MDTTIQTMLDRYSVTPETRAFIEAGHQKMFINGQFVDASDNATLSIEDPSNGKHLITVPCATTLDIDQAVAAANQAFRDASWADLKPMERQALLLKLADTMEEHAQTLAELESIDAGKAIAGCMEVDVGGSIELIRYMAGWTSKIEGATRNLSLPGDTMAYTLKEPVGVVGAIVPWNWPLNMSLWKIVAPLVTGCTIVLKPAEQTPMSMLYLMQIWQQAGLPDGVINIVTGTGALAGNHLVSHPDIQKVSFTGSTPTGKKVGQAAMENLSHVTLELGGKSAMVAFEDAYVDDIVNAAHQSIFFNSGQVCSAGSRLYVQRSMYTEVLDALSASLESVVIGDPLDPDTTQGPQISQQQLSRIQEYIELGKQEGARLVCGGDSPARPGYYVNPTILADTTNDMRIVQEEIFGPVLVVQPFDSEEEAITLANDNIYGLAASVFTRDVSRVHRVMRKLQAGTVFVNTHDAVDVAMPFGGYKQSGIGKDLGPEQLDHYLETKSVVIQL